MSHDEKSFREELHETTGGRGPLSILQPFWEELKYQLRKLFGKA